MNAQWNWPNRLIKHAFEPAVHGAESHREYPCLKKSTVSVHHDPRHQGCQQERWPDGCRFHPRTARPVLPVLGPVQSTLYLLVDPRLVLALRCSLCRLPWAGPCPLLLLLRLSAGVLRLLLARHGEPVGRVWPHLHHK